MVASESVAKLCHRVDIFRVRPTFDRVTIRPIPSNRQDIVSRLQESKEKRSGDEELELRTVRLASTRIGARQESRCLTRASSSIRCRLAFLRGRPGVYKYDIPWHAKQCRCIIDHVSHIRCCSYFKTFPNLLRGILINFDPNVFPDEGRVSIFPRKIEANLYRFLRINRVPIKRNRVVFLYRASTLKFYFHVSPLGRFRILIITKVCCVIPRRILDLSSTPATRHLRVTMRFREGFWHSCLRNLLELHA